MQPTRTAQKRLRPRKRLYKGMARATLLACVACVVSIATPVAFAAKPPVIDPLTSESSIAVSSLQPGQIVCVGKVEVRPGSGNVIGTIAAGSGSGLFAAQSKTPGLTSDNGDAWWSRRFAEREDGSVQFFLGGNNRSETATYYLYIGSEGTELTDVASIAQRRESPSKSKESSELVGVQAPLSPGAEVVRLGRQTLHRADTVRANLAWTGGGQVMVVCTDTDYNQDELLQPLQGIPGLPKPNPDNINTGKYGSVFYFGMGRSPLRWNSAAPGEGSCYLYVIKAGDVEGLHGDIAICGGDGTPREQWEL